MQKENNNIQNNDALKGFLFRAYNPRCYKNVGQALPDSRESFIKNNSCVVGSEQQHLRTSVSLNNTPSPALRASSPARGEEDVVCGFTLIELLVVVLIIGILAAVALPQYQKTVMRSRLVNLKLLAAAITQAQEAYYLEHGEYAAKFADLDIGMPGGKTDESTDTHYKYDWGFCYLVPKGTSGRDSFVGCSNSQISIEYQQRFAHSVDLANKRTCFALTSDANALQNKICQADSGATSYSGGTSYFGWHYN